jgi:hypothetical protein
VRRLAAVAALALALGGSGCGLRLQAEHVKVEVEDGSVRLVEPTDGTIRAGEVVIEILNLTDARRQFTLAKTAAAPDRLPRDLVDAYSYRDDADVVAVTGVMRPAEVQLQFGSIPRPQATKVKLHVYLHENRPYLLFDRLGGYREGYALKLEAQ